MIRFTSLAFVLVLLAACGGSSQSDGNAGKTTGETAPGAAAASSPKGVGPVTEFALGPLDAELAEHGKAVFETKCSACHKWAERYVGPALTGVTERREPEWILNMILNPDEMLKLDEQAKELFAQYLTPMTYQNVTREDAEAILMYFRSMDSGADE